jgi:hypothetical protein
MIKNKERARRTKTINKNKAQSSWNTKAITKHQQLKNDLEKQSPTKTVSLLAKTISKT